MVRKRVVQSLPHESVEGHFDVEELDEETNEVVEPVEKVKRSAGIIVVYKEPVHTFRSGQEVIRSGGVKERLFSLQTNGKNWKALAHQFIETCKESERRNKLPKDDPDYSSDRRPLFISMEEVE